MTDAPHPDDLRPSDYVHTSLRLLDSLRERLDRNTNLVERESVMRELAQAETALRRVLHLIGG